MKKIFFILLASLCIATTNAQVKSSINISPEISGGVGVKAGADLSIKLNNRLSLVPGIYWELRNRVDNEHSSKGIDYHARDLNHYISVPIRLGITLFGVESSRVSGTLLVGPYIACGVGGTSRWRITDNGTTTTNSCDAFTEESQCPTRFDYGLNFGFNILLKEHFVIGAYGEFGFKRIYQFKSNWANFFGSLMPGMTNHIALGLNFGYQF